MKLSNIFGIGIIAFTLTACNNDLKKDVQLTVNTLPADGVSIKGDTIMVKAGTPLHFNLNGDPDYITFFSGEPGQEFRYRERTEVDPQDIASSELQFSLWYQYGSRESASNLIEMYVSDNFPGLKKKDFKADSTNVVNQHWEDIVPAADLPQAPGNAKSAKSYTVDMTKYLSKDLTIAIKYKGHTNTATQPRANFVGMKLVNTMKNGTTTTLMASNFNFTPLNMDNGLKDRYQVVNNNTEGAWNLNNAAAGDFYCHSTGSKKPLRYSWLVSDHIKSNACTPDQGTPIKSLNESLSTYNYTYHKPGVYTADFLAVNGNYKQDKSMTCRLIIKVTE